MNKSVKIDNRLCNLFEKYDYRNYMSSTTRIVVMSNNIVIKLGDRVSYLHEVNNK